MHYHFDWLTFSRLVPAAMSEKILREEKTKHVTPKATSGVHDPPGVGVNRSQLQAKTSYLQSWPWVPRRRPEAGIQEELRLPKWRHGASSRLRLRLQRQLRACLGRGQMHFIFLALADAWTLNMHERTLHINKFSNSLYAENGKCIYRRWW